MANGSWLTRLSALGVLAISLGELSASAIASYPSLMSQDVAQAQPVTASDRPILRVGSQGEVVSELQGALKLLGYYTDVVDGVYRESTAIAVYKFQQAAGLTPDGIAGPATWNRLFPSSSSAATPSAVMPPAVMPPATKPSVVTPAPTSTNNPASSFPVPSIIQTRTAPPEVPATRNPPNSRNQNNSTSTPTTPSSTDSPQPVAVTLPILRRGMQGPAVTQLQERLKTLGFLPGSVDGFFGEATQSAVTAFQEQSNIVPDGVVGPATWSALLR